MKWEYKILEDIYIDRLFPILQQEGERGWELVAMERTSGGDRYSLVFKRAKRFNPTKRNSLGRD